MFVPETLSPLLNSIDVKATGPWYQISGIDVLAGPGRLLVCSRRLQSPMVTRQNKKKTNTKTTKKKKKKKRQKKPPWKRPGCLTRCACGPLQAVFETRSVGVSKQGIGGNHRAHPTCVPNALSRSLAMSWLPAGVVSLASLFEA